MQPVKDRETAAGEDLIRRSAVASEALEREEQRVIDPELDPTKLRGVMEDIGAVAQENVHLRIVAQASREYLAAEFEDDRYFAREKLKASVASWERWESQRDGQ